MIFYFANMCYYIKCKIIETIRRAHTRMYMYVYIYVDLHITSWIKYQII